jgi:hypothetical protein
MSLMVLGAGSQDRALFVVGIGATCTSTAQASCKSKSLLKLFQPTVEAMEFWAYFGLGLRGLVLQRKI